MIFSDTGESSEKRTSASGKALQQAYVGAGRSREDRDRELALSYLPIVKHEVLRFKMKLPPHIDADDLYGVGVAGLMSAVSRYEPGMDKTFGGYVRRRVRGAILDDLRRQDWISRGARRKSREYRKTVDAIEQREGRPATEEEIRAELGLKPAEFAKLLAELKPLAFLSMDDDHADSEEGGTTLHDRLADEAAGLPADGMEREELVDLLRRRLEALPEVQRKVLGLYYFEGLRLSEIGRVFGLTESRICQIHTQAIQGLRAFMKRAMEQ